MECYFTKEINEAFIMRCQHYKNDILRSSTAFACYYCNVYCSSKKVFEKDLCVCARKPGVVYSFNNQHLSTFEDNFTLMGDQPFSVYFDLETTCGKDKLVFDFDDEHLTDMYVISYCFIVVFHKSYSLEKITIVRSFNDSMVDLADLSSVPLEMLEFRDNVTTSQLYNCIQNVVAKKTHHALIEMFCCELKLIVDICKKWIQKKSSSRMELSLATKRKFKEQNPLNFDDKCCICGVELSASKKYGPKSNKMTYWDFLVKKEYHFLQNNFSKEELQMSDSILNLETYYEHFEMFIYVSVHLCLKYNKKSLVENLTDEKIKNFWGVLESVTLLFQEISDMKIKGINLETENKRDHLRNSRLKTILYVYRETFDFPGDKREISVFVSKNFATSVMNLLFSEIWVHHLHVSGDIHGYAHDFCNRKVKELYKQPISAFAHNLSRFGFFFVLKGLRLSL